MTWLSEHWLDILGWSGSVLLVWSLLQANLLRLRIFNLVACVMLTVFNAVLHVWPMVGMNVVLAAINAWFVIQMIRVRHDDATFEVLEVSSSDEYLRHVLRVHAADIAKFNPGFSFTTDARTAFLVQRGDETVGVVLLRQVGDNAEILLDYVTPRYRDFSPGEFVWRRSGLLARRGIKRVVTPAGMVGAYYDRLGFQRVGESYVLDVAAG